jgi:gamma-glutamyl:cysteine ligase YbdK (ATP-grasp superfamily)
MTAADAGGTAREPARRGDYQQNRWAALRFGPRAELLHPEGDRVTAAPELARELLTWTGPAVDELGTRDLLGVLDPTTCEADRQLEVGRSDGVAAVCADLVERSLWPTASS